MQHLWDAIFTTMRITGDGQSAARWHEHMARLHRRIDRLNKLNFVSLHYQNALGTDLTVRLPEGHVWEGGDDRLPSGVPFIANMPTEEIFTSPLRDGVDGVVYASMPLVHGGNIIDGFHFVVKDGKIVEAHAARGEDVRQSPDWPALSEMPSTTGHYFRGVE